MLHRGTDLPDNKKTLMIKRYARRRLYNTETSDYVTLEDIARFIHGAGIYKYLILNQAMI